MGALATAIVRLKCPLHISVPFPGATDRRFGASVESALWGRRILPIPGDLSTAGGSLRDPQIRLPGGSDHLSPTLFSSVDCNPDAEINFTHTPAKKHDDRSACRYGSKYDLDRQRAQWITGLSPWRRRTLRKAPRHGATTSRAGKSCRRQSRLPPSPFPNNTPLVIHSPLWIGMCVECGKSSLSC